MNWINETGEKDYMALADVISQLGTTIINLVSNTVQGIADYINNNSGDISDTGGGTTGTPGTITIPDPLTVNQLNTSMIYGTVSSSGTPTTPGSGIVGAICSGFTLVNINYPWGDPPFWWETTQFAVGVVDTSLYDETDQTNFYESINYLHLFPKTQRDNPTDSGLYVEGKWGTRDPVLTNATLPNTEFSMLNTIDKTIIGAINELKATLDNLGI